MAQLGRLYKYATDTSGNATSGVSLTIYREGATVNGAQNATGPTTFTIIVRHNGKIKASDTVFIGTATSISYTVTAVTATTIAITLVSGTLNLADGDRIVPSNSKPTLYSDDQAGSSTFPGNPFTSSATGLWSCWLEFGAYDMLQSGGGLQTTLHEGLVIGSEAPGQIRYADDFAANSTTGGIQEAIDDLPSAGGKVICSGKTYSLNTTIWLHSGVHLEGAGVGATILQRASNSITNGSAASSGGVISLGPKGSNGVLFSSGTPGSNISISNLTMDGNQSTQTVTVTAPAPVGLRASWTTGLYVDNVKVINTLQTAYYISTCTDINFSDFFTDSVGQWSTVSDRNALSVYGCTRGSFSNFSFKDTGDEAIASGNNSSSCTFGPGIVDGCDFVIELQGSGSGAMTDSSFSDIVCTNVLSTGITFNSTGADTYSQLQFNNISLNCHATDHDAGIIYMSGTTYDVSNVYFNNIRATNVNSKDVTTSGWIDCQAGSGKIRSNIYFNGIELVGLNSGGLGSSTRTADTALSLRGNLSIIEARDCSFFFVPGIGIGIDDSAATTIDTLRFTNVNIAGANAQGIEIRNDTAANTISNITFNNCTIANTCAQLGGTVGGIYLLANKASSVITDIYFKNCRAYTNGAGQDYGLLLEQVAGTLTKIFIEGCDFSGNATNWMYSTGTVTNVHFIPPNGRGTDILSAATIVIPPDGSIFHVTATNNITNGVTVNPWDNGRKVILMFEDILTMSDTGTSVLSAAYVTSANDTLVLCCDGTSWFELSRSAN